MSYILQNEMITKCMPSHSPLFLSSNPNTSYLEEHTVAFPPGDCHAIFTGVTVASFTYNLAKFLNTF